MTRRFATCALAALALALPASAAQGATTFTLTGHGWGHGIGMSQYGALGYAQHGWGYAQILDHYFTGTHVAPLPRSVHERVLLSSGSAVHFGASSGMTLKDAAGQRRSLTKGSYRLQPGGTSGHLQLVDEGHRRGDEGPRRPGADQPALPAAAPGRLGRDRLCRRPLARLVPGDRVRLEPDLRRRRRAREVPARGRAERDARVVAAAGAQEPGRRGPLLRGRHQESVGLLRRVCRHPQPGVRPDRARVAGLDAPRWPPPPTGSSTTRARLRRRSSRPARAGAPPPSRRRGTPTPASPTSCPCPTATTAPAAPTRTTRGRRRRSRPPASRTRSGSPGSVSRSPRPSTRPRSGC